MKGLGLFLIALGALGLLAGLQMGTTVTTPSQTVGFGEFSTYVPSQSVHNIGLMDQRRNVLIAAGFVFVAGIILYGFGAYRVQARVVQTIRDESGESSLTVEKIIVVGSAGFVIFILASRFFTLPQSTVETIVLVWCAGFIISVLASWFFTRR